MKNVIFLPHVDRLPPDRARSAAVKPRPERLQGGAPPGTGRAPACQWFTDMTTAELRCRWSADNGGAETDGGSLAPRARLQARPASGPSPIDGCLRAA